MDYTRSYLMITAGCGTFSMISNCFSNVIRTEGEPMKAMTGTVIGNLLNIILDPIMILGFKWGITGAAVATVIGNLVSALYYLAHFFGGKSSLSISPRDFSMKDGILKGVVSVGISASLANLLVSLSSIVVNGQLAGYGDMFVAGYGVTSKVLMIVTLVGIGIGSGVQPLIGYCFGAKNRERLTGSIRFSAIFGIIACLVVAAVCFIFAGPIVRAFLTNDEAYSVGIRFTRILMSTAWLIGAFAVCQNSLQAIGAASPALLASVFRQGVIFIPVMFILKAVIGVDGLVWAQPVADVLSLVIVAVMLVSRLRKAKL
ncbi:MAG: polysaccharide biosynthesis C-terminal domain-containing protein [Oscillospiraceae bacterium]|nr:polysaccharide biosynthesis C-terminal domain-containing protein [Oscillospiraceae bacterium]